MAQTELIAVVPAQYAERVASELGLCVYEPPIAMGVPEISMYWHSRHDRNPAHRWLRDQVRQATGEFRR